MITQCNKITQLLNAPNQVLAPSRTNKIFVWPLKWHEKNAWPNVLPYGGLLRYAIVLGPICYVIDWKKYRLSFSFWKYSCSSMNWYNVITKRYRDQISNSMSMWQQIISQPYIKYPISRINIYAIISFNNLKFVILIYYAMASTIY